MRGVNRNMASRLARDVRRLQNQLELLKGKTANEGKRKLALNYIKRYRKNRSIQNLTLMRDNLKYEYSEQPKSNQKAGILPFPWPLLNKVSYESARKIDKTRHVRKIREFWRNNQKREVIISQKDAYYLMLLSRGRKRAVISQAPGMRKHEKDEFLETHAQLRTEQGGGAQAEVNKEGQLEIKLTNTSLMPELEGGTMIPFNVFLNSRSNMSWHTHPSSTKNPGVWGPQPWPEPSGPDIKFSRDRWPLVTATYDTKLGPRIWITINGKTRRVRIVNQDRMDEIKAKVNDFQKRYAIVSEK